MNLLESLNPQQRAAVQCTEGPLLVLAGAGSGKTRVLTYRIAYLIKEKGVLPGSILALTFTNKAANEMKERILQLVGDLASEIWVSTFHSTCVRILRRDIEKIGYSRSFVIYDDSDQLEIIKECLKELNYNEKYFNPKNVRAVIGQLKDQLKSPEDFSKEAAGEYREEQMAKIYALYEDKLKKNNALDFDDLLNKTLELFYLRPDVLDYYRRKFQYILVDEYQDTNFAQYMFIKLLSDFHQNICVVGDDDQSIYGWRGADIRNILDFEKDFPTAKTIKLEENYRSCQNILDAANEIIRNNKGRKDKRLWTKKEQGEKIQIYTASNEQEEAEFVCKEIKRIVEKGRKPSDCAVLYRMNAQSRVLEEALMKYAIPYRVYGGLRFYDRKEIKDIIAYLRLIVNPEDDVSFRRIVNVPKRGIGDATLAILEEYAVKNGESLFSVALDSKTNAVLNNRTAKRLADFVNLISTLMAMKEVMGLTEFVQKLIEQTGYKEMLEAENTPESENRLENIKEFVSAAKEFEQANPEAGLVEFLENVALVSDLDKLDSANSAITLMTLHSAKGLEFPVVFLTGLEEGLFPHSRSMESDDEIEEERRLCYVGITRAKERLYLSYALQRNLYGNPIINTPSRFLREIPDHLKVHLSYRSGSSKDFGKTVSSNNTRNMGSVSNPKLSSEYVLGEKVQHSKFGIGTIVSIIGEGSNKQIKIAFDQAGIRTFMADLAPLKKL